LHILGAHEADRLRRQLIGTFDRSGPDLTPTQKSGYIMARMRREVVLAPEAARAYRSLSTHRRAEVRDALERHLRYEPTRVSKSRIKRLRGLSQPQYRLRVGEVRVFYDVTREAVEVLAIVTKAEAAGWLAEHGTPDAPGGAR